MTTTGPIEPNSGAGQASGIGDSFQKPEFFVALIVNKYLIKGSSGNGPSIEDIQHIRDPNLLASKIILYSAMVFGNKEQEVQKKALSLNILTGVLNHEKVNQGRYLSEYEAALNNAFEYYKQVDMPGSFHEIPENRMWRVYDTSKLEQSLANLDSVWSSGPRLLVPEQFNLTQTGHGVQVAHTLEKERLENEGLQKAVGIINEVLKSGAKLDEQTFCVIHTLIAEYTRAFNVISGNLRQINLGYRSTDAFRAEDLLIFPPLPTESFAELLAIRERYGLKEPPPEISHALTVPPSAGGSAQELTESLSFQAAIAKLTASATGQATIQSSFGNPELHRLMRKYFIWQDKATDKTDLLYKTEQKPLSDGIYKHPAVVLAAQAFNRAFFIHPFENGNTRTSSFGAANYVLSKYGYPPLVLTKENEQAFYKIHRFVRFPMDIFYNTHSDDVTEWNKVNDADKQLAAFFADEIIKKIAILL